MAASQARFLGLTARKTNVEYEGQQINQQRTTLSNQTANYYNQLLGMSVPVPPSVADYTKTVYTFQDGALTNSISSMIAKEDGKYIISYNSSWVDDFDVVSTRSSLVNCYVKYVNECDDTLYQEFVNGTAGGCYNYALNHNGNQIKHLVHTLNHLLKYGTYTTSNGDSLTVAGDDHYWTVPDGSYGGDAQIMSGIAEKIDGTEVQQKFIDLLYECRNIGSEASAEKSDELKARLKGIVESDLKSVFYQEGNYMIGADTLRELGTCQDCEKDESGNITKYTGNDKYLKTLSADQLNNLLVEENEYMAMLNNKYGVNTWFTRYILNTTSNTWEPFFYSVTDLNNAIYSDYTLQQSHINCYTIGSAQKNEEVKGIEARFEQDSTGRLINVTLKPGQQDEVTYAVSTNTITDQAKYDDAMNQYEYDKYQYDQAIQEINAKIEIIQAEDKNLELRLKQLDTEQEAIQTEIDAVSKVIEKNTESSFKTFG